MRSYTLSQGEADSVDLDLFRLASKARRMSENLRVPRSERVKWRAVELSILRARSAIRPMMHPDTTKEMA